MKVENNKMVAVEYKLTVDGQIADQSQPGSPLEFIVGAGMLLPKFEEALMGKEPGDKVSFTLSPGDGYGEIMEEAIVDLPKNIFMVDGKLAEDILFEGSQVPMSDQQGNRMLDFEVEVVSVRDVTPEDLAAKGGCSCGECDCEGGEHDCCGEGHCH